MRPETNRELEDRCINTIRLLYTPLKLLSSRL